MLPGRRFQERVWPLAAFHMFAIGAYASIAPCGKEGDTVMDANCSLWQRVDGLWRRDYTMRGGWRVPNSRPLSHWTRPEGELQVVLRWLGPALKRREKADYCAERIANLRWRRLLRSPVMDSESWTPNAKSLAQRSYHPAQAVGACEQTVDAKGNRITRNPGGKRSG